MKCRPLAPGGVRASVLSLFAASALFTGCNKPAAENAITQKPALPPIPVTVVPVKSLELQRSVRVVGSLVGLETATLSNRVTGIVSKIYVDRGDRVKPNQKLLEIEPDRFELAQHDAEAGLQETLARLGLQEVPGEEFDVNRTAPVKKAQSEYDNAKSKMDRSTPLNQQHVLNDFEYLDIVSAFKTSESALEASRDEARALVAQARQARTQIDMRKKDFHDSVILAPDGSSPDGTKIASYVVTDRKISAGEYLREGTALFTLLADDTLKLQARVPEKYLSDIKTKALVDFKDEAYPTESFEGQVVRVDPMVDPVSRTFMVEALVDNVAYQKRLRPGSFVPGEVLTKKEPDKIMVPQEAVTSFVGVTKIYRMDGDNKVKAITVSTGQQKNIAGPDGKETTWVEIIAAPKTIGPEDRVVVSGLTKLVDGSPVTIDAVPATGPAATAGKASQ